MCPQNTAAMSIICATCKQTFLSTSREPQYDLFPPRDSWEPFAEE